MYVFYDESNGFSFTINSVVHRLTLPAPGGERDNDADFAYSQAYLVHLNLSLIHILQEIEKIQDQTQAEAEFNKSVAPLLQKENDEINKIAQPMMQAIHNAVETIRVEKKMDVVLDDPYTIRAADANSKIENITNEVISRLKK